MVFVVLLLVKKRKPRIHRLAGCSHVDSINNASSACDVTRGPPYIIAQLRHVTDVLFVS